MLVCVMHISNEKADRRVLLRRLAHICELRPCEARMLVDDDMISEDIDLADSDDGFADVERIELPVSYARHDILIEELARVEHASELSTLKVRLRGYTPTHRPARGIGWKKMRTGNQPPNTISP